MASRIVKIPLSKRAAVVCWLYGKRVCCKTEDGDEGRRLRGTTNWLSLDLLRRRVLAGRASKAEVRLVCGCRKR